MAQVISTNKNTSKQELKNRNMKRRPTIIGCVWSSTHTFLDITCNDPLFPKKSSINVTKDPIYTRINIWDQSQT